MKLPQLPAPRKAAAPKDSWSARGYMRFGLVCVLILAGGVGGWAATAELAGAVIAGGQLRVQSNKQVVEHPDGGVVGEILVRDGDTVEAGQVLVKLDDTLLRAELAALESQLFEIMARRGRLEAEITGKSDISFDPELIDRGKTDPALQNLMDGQRALFAARRDSISKQYAILDERKLQLREQIYGTEAQIRALELQTELITQELTDKEKLLAGGHIRMSEILALKREQARLVGQSGELRARIGQLKGQITEAEIEQTRLTTTRLEESITESRELGFRELEQKERRISYLERLDRLEIRAPRSGSVIDSTVHTIKAVVRPADPIMYIIPTDTDLVVEARIQPIDIDVVRVGQEAVLRLSSLNSRTSPELFGEVTTISADVILDEKTGLGYYKAEVRLNDGELDKLDGQDLIPGMPVEVFISTGSRTAFAYMIKPVTDYFNRAMREN